MEGLQVDFTFAAHCLGEEACGHFYLLFLGVYMIVDVCQLRLQYFIHMISPFGLMVMQCYQNIAPN
jgi:hypothetical protein